MATYTRSFMERELEGGNRTTASSWHQMEEFGDFSQEHPSLSLEDSVREDLDKNLKERNMQYRCKAVEDVMAPLIHQVTSLTEFKATAMTEDDRERFLIHRRQFGNPHKLVQLVNKAVMNFVAVGEDIASENPDYQEELLLVCEEVRTMGEKLHEVATSFVRDTSRSERRGVMVHAARELLFSVTRLMVIADVIDVNNLLGSSNRIEEKLRALQGVESESDLMGRIQDYESDIAQITQIATLRQNETKSKAALQLLTAAQTELNQASRMLVSASKTFLHHSTVKAADENRELIIEGMLRSLKILSLLADGEDPSNIEGGFGKPQAGELATSFVNFETSLDKIACGYSQKVATSIQKELELILKASADFAESSCTRDYRQHVIITQSGALKMQLQRYLSLSSARGKVAEEEESKIFTKKCLTSLKRELHRASVDHVSDSYVGVFTPLSGLVKVAQEGHRGKVEKVAEVFNKHAMTMIKAASISCTLSMDVDGIQMARMAAKHVHTLIPQVIRAARTLVTQPSSSVLAKNMSIFSEAWMENVTLLIKSVDAIAPFSIFLVVTESHLFEDGVNLVHAADVGDRMTFERTVNMIQGRCSHLGHIVRTEMRENPVRYSGTQRKRIGNRVHKIERRSLKTLHDSVFKAKDKLIKVGRCPEHLRELKEAAEKIAEDVRDLCYEVLSTEELEKMGIDLDCGPYTPRPVTPTPSIVSQVSVSSTNSDVFASPRKFQRTPQHSQVFDTEDSAKAVMAKLSTEHQAQLVKVTADLTIEKEEFESEAEKWDAENDIVVLAKEMCTMMMDMSDFTLGIGSLRTIMDLIVTAKDIARAGECLCALARLIADQCPDAKSKNDLFAYVSRIKLHAHQLKITSAVKADTKSSTHETVDSASALITTAKNLMNAVVETVKASYIASVAIARVHGGSMPEQFTQWRLTLPRKKDLESTPNTADNNVAPMHQLGLFKPS